MGDQLQLNENNINIEEQKIIDNEVISTNKTELKENMPKNALANANAQKNNILKDIAIPTHMAPEINLSRLNSANIINQYSSWQAGDERLMAVEDASLKELDHMNFFQLSRWAAYHLHAKGDDHGQFAPIAMSMFGITKLLGEIEDDNSDSWAQMTRVDISKRINGLFVNLGNGIKTYMDNPKHKPNPFFKKGKMRAKLCRMLNMDKREEYREDIINRAANSLYKRETEFIKDTAYQNYRSDQLHDMVDHSTATKYVEEVKSQINEQRLKDLNESLKNKKDVLNDGIPIKADMRSVVIINFKEQRRKLITHYGLDDKKNKRTKNIFRALAIKGMSPDLNRNILLKHVEFDVNGEPLDKYKENDIWNQKYLDTYAMPIGQVKEQKDESPDDQILNNKAYEARLPFLREMYAELLTINIDDLMTKWVNPEYYLENIDDITRKVDLILRFFDNVLKDSINKRFINDELDEEEKKSFGKLSNLFIPYSYYFQYKMMGTLFVDPVGNISYEESYVAQIDIWKGQAEEAYNNIKKENVMDSLEAFKTSHARTILYNKVIDLRKENMRGNHDLNYNFNREQIALLKKQKKEEPLNDDEIEKIKNIPSLTKSWFELTDAVNLLYKESNAEEPDSEIDAYYAENLKKAAINFNEELNKINLKPKEERPFGKDLMKRYRRVARVFFNASNEYLKNNPALADTNDNNEE